MLQARAMRREKTVMSGMRRMVEMMRRFPRVVRVGFRAILVGAEVEVEVEAFWWPIARMETSIATVKKTPP